MYTYDIDAGAMFEDRTHQFEKFGIPLDESRPSGPPPPTCGPTHPAAGSTSGPGWPRNTPTAATITWRR